MTYDEHELKDMYNQRLVRNIIRVLKNIEGLKVDYSSFGKPSWPSGPYAPPGSVPPPNTYPAHVEESPPQGYEVPPWYDPPPNCPECPTQCCSPPGQPPEYCPPVKGDTPPLCADCRGRRRICPPPSCYPGPVPYNPCCPVFPKPNPRRYKLLFFFFFLPLILLAALNAFGNEQCPKGPCREYEYMRRRTKRFPWGDGNTTLFHNEHVNHLPEECEPPPLICFPTSD